MTFCDQDPGPVGRLDLLDRPVAPVFSAKDELDAIFLGRVRLVEQGDRGIGLEPADQVTEGREDHVIVGIHDADLNLVSESFDGGFGDRRFPRTELALDVPDFGERVVVAKGNVERVSAVSKNFKGVPFAPPVSRLLGERPSVP